MWNDGDSFGAKKPAARQKKLIQGYQGTMRRTAAQLKVSSRGTSAPNAVIDCRMVYEDFGENAVNLFCETGIEMGSTVSLTIDEPRRFYCRGKVVSHQEVSASSKIIQTKSYNHRICVQFICESDEDKKAIADFRAELMGLTQAA